jgi:hypothetical protein
MQGWNLGWACQLRWHPVQPDACLGRMKRSSPSPRPFCPHFLLPQTYSHLPDMLQPSTHARSFSGMHTCVHALACLPSLPSLLLKTSLHNHGALPLGHGKGGNGANAVSDDRGLVPGLHKLQSEAGGRTRTRFRSIQNPRFDEVWVEAKPTGAADDRSRA